MEELIKVHQQAKQKQIQANTELNDLLVHKNELERKVGTLASNVNIAEQRLSKALTKEDLEEARARVEEARKNKSDIKTLLKNIEQAIKDNRTKLPTLHNDILLAEADIWKVQQEQLIQTIKEQHPATLQLIMKAYVASWKSGYGWGFEHFIREKIMGADFHVNHEVLAQLENEMAKQIWPVSDTQTSSQ